MIERTGIINRDSCKVINICLQYINVNTSQNKLAQAKLRRQRSPFRQNDIATHSVKNKSRVLDFL
jgi:hypothetical protein